MDCEECDSEYDLATASTAASSIVIGAAEFAAVLVDSHADVRARREPTQRERVLRARRTDRPAFDPMGREERVDHDGYAEQEPDDVAGQLTIAAQLYANVLADVAAVRR